MTAPDRSSSSLESRLGRVPFASRGLAATVILLATVLAFLPLRHARFLQDDHAIVQLNPLVHRGDWLEILRTDYWAGVGGSELSLYRPVTIASFALERGSDGKVPPGRAHWTNVLLHGAAALAVWGLALRLRAGPSSAWIAGLLFALHPIHLSVVAGLVGRAEILAALFSTAALLAWTAAGAWEGDGRFAPSPGGWRPRVAAWGAAVLVLFAFGSKESAFALPALLVASDLLLRAPRRGDLVAWLLERSAALAPTLLAVLGYGILRTAAIGAFPGTQRPRLADNLLAGLDGSDRLATALSLAWRAFRLLVWPSRLSADYSGPVIPALTSLAAPGAILGLLVLLGFAALSVAPVVHPSGRSGRPAVRALAFAAALFLLPYLIVANLFVLVGIVFAERLLYLPSLGFCLTAGFAAGGLAALVAAWGVTEKQRRLALILAGGVLFVAVGGWVRARTADWQTDATLWEATARAVPDSPRALFTLAKIRLEQGREDEAMSLFARTVVLWPGYSAAWMEQGAIFARRGLAADALRCLREAVRRNPWNAEAAEGAARLLVEQGRFAEAESLYRRAVRLGRRDLVPAWSEAAARARASAAQAPL